MPERTCSVDGCTKPAKARGWCDTHYMRWRTHGDAEFVRRVVCQICGCEFQAKNKARICRDHECRRKAAARSPRKQVVCSVDGCTAFSDSRGLCVMHYGRLKRVGDPLGLELQCAFCDKRFYRAGGRGQRPKTCGSRECRREYNKSRYDKRRALIAGGAVVETVIRAVVFERDGWRCHICQRPVRADMPWPHPLSPSVDHLVPLSLGGSESYANVRCAHLRCNQAKGNRALNEQLRLV